MSKDEGRPLYPPPPPPETESSAGGGRSGCSAREAVPLRAMAEEALPRGAGIGRRSGAGGPPALAMAAGEELGAPGADR